MIHLTITHGSDSRIISLSAENMAELIDDKLPKWLPRLDEDLPMLKKTKRFKADPKGEEQKEIDSGWYYDV
jgi:hypothetical protein|tara:strand:- start:68 stop:280 length:213 start_codon:yes stop_codon:yes gene_type:complete